MAMNDEELGIKVRVWDPCFFVYVNARYVFVTKNDLYDTVWCPMKIN